MTSESLSKRKSHHAAVVCNKCETKSTGRVPVVGFHSPDPGHQAMGGLGGFLDHLRLKVGIVHVGPDLGNDLRRDIVLVICLKLL